MKILVFENEYDSVKGAFETAKLLNFNNQLEIEAIASSQKANWTSISDYDVIFVDIDLSTRSSLDGYAVITKIKALNSELIKRIVVLTGNNKIMEMLKERGLYNEFIQIVNKPTNFEEIAAAITQVKKQTA